MSSFERLQPQSPSFGRLCDVIGERAEETARFGPWRSGAFAILAQSGVLAAFIPADCGGTESREPVIIESLVAIAERCLTTALALTQWASACRIIAAGPPEVRAVWLPALARGDTCTTVGISHLSTSRRHLAAPALAARRESDGWRLNGTCPWVTGADDCDSIVTGALTASGEQLFFIVPTDAAGLSIAPPLDMLALAGSRTSSVAFDGVRPAAVIAPSGGGVRTGGLATTALALGSTRAALAVLDAEAANRPGLAPIAERLRAEVIELAARLDVAASEGITPESRDRFRGDANGLVIRAAQAALTASKGAGFVAGHPAERLVRESLFFLVWSCPQTVADAMLCDLAGT
ncbi:MAG: acyl-CoA dehydrogenase family protein [Planctomycetia bacterium]